MYSYIDLTATVLNCRLPATWHINYIRLSWCGSLIKLLRLQLMICFTQISRKTETGKSRNRGFLCKTEPKPNRKWNRRNITALFVCSEQKGYWRQRVDKRHGNPPQGNQELLVVKGKVGRSPGELGVSKSIECDIFSSALWRCWLGNRKGIRPVKNWVLVCWWWWFDWSFGYSL